MVKINGYWLGLGLISLIDYTWLVFNSAIYNNAISTITGIFVIVSFGLAIKNSKINKKNGKQKNGN